MFRSPPQLRSGKKGKPVSLSVSSVSSDKKLQRSLSASSSSSPRPTTMPTDNKPATTIDAAFVERCIGNYFTSGEGLQVLFQKLTDEIKLTVEAAVTNALAAAQVEVKKLQDKVNNLTMRLGRLDEKLEMRTEELEQYQRRTNLRIFGVEEKDGENTDQLVVDLCRERLGVDLALEQLSRSHRVGRPQRQSAPNGRKQSRAIIVRFCSYRDRRRVFEAKKRLKGSGVVIKEDLTAHRAEVLRQATARFGVGKTWTQDGRVQWIDQQGVRGTATRLTDLPVVESGPSRPVS